MKSIKKGYYYWHFDTSIKKKHPSLVYKKNEKSNQYNIVCFTSSNGKRRTKLNYNIDPKNRNKDCFVLNSPQRVKRNALGQNLSGFGIVDKRDKAMVKKIARKKS